MKNDTTTLFFLILSITSLTAALIFATLNNKRQDERIQAIEHQLIKSHE